MAIDKDLKKLREAIKKAEKFIEENKEKNTKKLKRKCKKLPALIEEGYSLLNTKSKDKKAIDRIIFKIEYVLNDEGIFILYFKYIMYGLLGCALVFTGNEAYTFYQNNLDIIRTNIDYIVKVNFIETNIVDLNHLLPVDDEVGLKNPMQEFSITNDDTKMPDIDYKVNYMVSIKELNEDSNTIDKKYIKYKYYKVDNDGRQSESKIGVLSDLEKNSDGTYKLFSASQKKSEKDNYKVVFWISSEAGNDQQGKHYTFKFDVSAVVATN